MREERDRFTGGDPQEDIKRSRYKRNRMESERKRADKKAKKRMDKATREDAKIRLANQHALEREIEQAKTSKDLNKIRVGNYALPLGASQRLKNKLNKKKLKVKRDELNKKDKLAVDSIKNGVDLSVGLIPIVGVFLAFGINKSISGANKVRNSFRARFKVTEDDGRTSLASKLAKLGITALLIIGFFYMAVMGFIIASGGIISILLSHPEAIRELHANNVLGDALYMGNVTGDVLDKDGNILVKGRPDASPGCFIYNGLWYCGNCNAVSADEDDCGDGGGHSGGSADGASDSAGQGDFTDEAAEWIKDFEFTYIGDSLGVGVKPALSPMAPKANFDVKSSRFLKNGAVSESNDGLNGLYIINQLKEANQIKDVVVIALGTNGGLDQDMLNEAYDLLPSNVKTVIFINTGSVGGGSGYGNINYEDISKQIKDFAGSKSNVKYLDWLTYSHKYGWDKITSDSVHMNGEGVDLYAKFTVQGLYDLFKGGGASSNNSSSSSNRRSCKEDSGNNGSLDGVKIGEIDDSKLRDGVTVTAFNGSAYVESEEGLKEWPKRAMYILSNLFPEVTSFSGYRAGDSDGMGTGHGDGLAIDFMVANGVFPESFKTGDTVSRWIMDNQEALNVSYIIWRQRMYPALYTGGAKEWVQMVHRGDLVQNHYDHVHISFNAGDGDVSKLKMPTSSDAKIEPWDTAKDAHGGTGGNCDGAKYPNKCGDETGGTTLKNAVVKQATPGKLYIPATKKGADEQGYRRDIIKNFPINAENPSHLDADFIIQFLQEAGHGDSPFVQKDLAETIIKGSEETGIAVGLFLGQVAKESQFGKMACGGEYNIGCLIYDAGPDDWGPMVAGRWANPPSYKAAIEYWYVYVKKYYYDEGLTTYRKFKEKYAPPCDALLPKSPSHDELTPACQTIYDNFLKIYNDPNSTALDIDHFEHGEGGGGPSNALEVYENYTWGVLVALGYDVENAQGTNVDNGNSNNNRNPLCADNCRVSDSEQNEGTGNNKALPEGETWENGDEIINSDLSYMPDTVNANAINKFIKEEGPNDNGFKNLGNLFMEAATKSGYDARYLLAHAIVATNWGRSDEWKNDNNPYLLMENGDNNSTQLMRFKSQKEGLVLGAQTIYKNYYGGGQKTLYEMVNSENGDHNISNDKDWATKVASYMKKTEEYMGASTGGSLNNNQNPDDGPERLANASIKRTKLGRSCSFDGFESKNLPIDIDSDGFVSYWFKDPKYTTHTGMDMSYNQQSYLEGPIYAVADGEVVEAESSCSVGNRDCGGGWGNYIKVKHNDQYSTLYAHLKTLDVKVGDTVSAGQVIGVMGTTGRSDGNHLHFELWKDGGKVDPYDYFDWGSLPQLWEHPSGRDPECEAGGVSNTTPGGNHRDVSCSVDGNDSGGPGELTGGDTAEKVYNFFKGYGYSDEGIAGILGNMQHESGVDPHRFQGVPMNETQNLSSDELNQRWAACNGGPGLGIIQWETTVCGGSGRWDTMSVWAKKNGKDVWDLKTQLEWLAFEIGLETPPSDAGVWVSTSTYELGGQADFDKAMKGNSIDEAVAHFERAVERSAAGSGNWPTRVEAAKEYYALMDGWK